jgi:hypothetical protein
MSEPPSFHKFICGRHGGFNEHGQHCPECIREVKENLHEIMAKPDGPNVWKLAREAFLLLTPADMTPPARKGPGKEEES